jgi:hypothetical protein
VAGLGEAKAMVIQATVLLVKAELEVASRRFSDAAGNFIGRDLYVFVLDMAG